MAPKTRHCSTSSADSRTPKFTLNFSHTQHLTLKNHVSTQLRHKAANAHCHPATAELPTLNFPDIELGEQTNRAPKAAVGLNMLRQPLLKCRSINNQLDAVKTSLNLKSFRGQTTLPPSYQCQ
jgi:hypothetical protein